MTHKSAHQTVCILLFAASCTTPNPSGRRPPSDASADGAVSGSIDAPSDGPPLCTANQAVRCEAGSLVRCNGNGTAELKEACALGCVAADLRCADLLPSNGLATFLDQTIGQSDLNLGNSATIDTDTGVVTADYASVAVKSETLTQPGGPTVRVFIVRSFIANHVTVTGGHALAIVSHGDAKVTGIFAASAKFHTAGAGAFGDYVCDGGDQRSGPGLTGGAGGGGFGSPGGSGGTAKRAGFGDAPGALGGKVTGNESLIPLRGGCNGGIGYRTRGAGGGAIQLVSRTQIVVSGTIAANGSWNTGGGGSGGGILLESPIVVVSGGVVANGGGGIGGLELGAAENGRLDATPAAGGPGSSNPGDGQLLGRGGNGGAGTIGAENGQSVDDGTSRPAFAGHGGGGFGRIRVNTVPGGLRSTGLISPNPSQGALATR